MKLIGVTGSIATGKTTVVKAFKKLGAFTMNADKIVHEIYKKDKDVKRKVVKEFGKKILTRGKIDRHKLARYAFKDKKSIKRLCKIVHPEVLKKIAEGIKRTKKRIIILDAPLLIEAGLNSSVDCIIVVSSSLAKQIERSRKIGLTRDELLRRRALQMSLKRKEKFADYIISNNGSKLRIRKGVKKIWQKLKRR